MARYRRRGSQAPENLAPCESCPQVLLIPPFNPRLLNYPARGLALRALDVTLRKRQISLNGHWLPGPLAQSVEQRTFNPWVVGSIPTGPTHLTISESRELLEFPMVQLNFQL